MAKRIDDVHARLFHDDVKKLKAIAAEKGTRWHDELRLLVQSALARMIEPERRPPDADRG